MLERTLIGFSAVLVFLLGAAHVLFTFSGNRLDPRDVGLKAAMQSSALVITRETTMWKTWIGFNASHGFGLLLFGTIYGYFALNQSVLLFSSPFLLTAGVLMLCGYLFLARSYFFSIPFRGIVLAFVSFVGAILVSLWA